MLEAEAVTQLLVEVGPGLLLDAGRGLHVERLVLGGEGGLLELQVGLGSEGVEQLAQGPVRAHGQGPGVVTAHGTVGLPLVPEHVRVDGLVARVHHVILVETERGRRARGDLQRLVAAARGDDRVGRRDGGNDVLHDSLRERVGYTADTEFLGTC